MIAQCPKCSAEFEAQGKWGLKKFCSRSCANSREQTDEVREKKRNALSIPTKCQYCDFVSSSKNGLSSHEKSCSSNPKRIAGPFFGRSHTFATKLLQAKSIGDLREPESILDMSKRTISKVLKRLGVGCSRCGWNESSCDIHHILPRSKGGDDSDTNLTILCPNCHRLAHTGKLDKFVSVKEQIGEVWRKHYYAHK